jgi:hypothetical protein
VAVIFIGGGNRRTQRKPLTCHKSLNMLFFVPSFTRRITKSGTAYLTGIRLTTYMNKFNVFFNYIKTKTIETIKNMLTLITIHLQRWK